ncbi:MAG: flagellar motor protein MotB [Deltaproteobacteria bacterium]|nr:flagellar motor protein MotB [Deltaproteobacteria bacterium]
MDNQFLFSRQRDTTRSDILRAGSVEEDTFSWGLADLLMLLLIFFIFLYVQSSGQILSGAPTSPSSTAAASVAAVHPGPIPLHRMESPIFTPISNKPNEVPTLRDTHPSKPMNTAPVVSNSPAIPEPPQKPLETEISRGSWSEGSMEGLRQEALSAIHETEESACSIRWNQNRLVFVLGERFTFPVGEAHLLADFEPTLNQIAGLIAAKKEYRVMVSGHTDDTPIATDQFPSNWELSAARAITVAKSIIRSGVDPRRITIQGYGEFRPLHENSSPENKEANRRVEIALFKEDYREQDSEPLY